MLDHCFSHDSDTYGSLNKLFRFFIFLRLHFWGCNFASVYFLFLRFSFWEIAAGMVDGWRLMVDTMESIHHPSRWSVCHFRATLIAGRPGRCSPDRSTITPLRHPGIRQKMINNCFPRDSDTYGTKIKIFDFFDFLRFILGVQARKLGPFFHFWQIWFHTYKRTSENLTLGKGPFMMDYTIRKAFYVSICGGRA